MPQGAKHTIILGFPLSGVLLIGIMPIYLAAQGNRTGPPPVVPKLEKIKDNLI